MKRRQIVATLGVVLSYSLTGCNFLSEDEDIQLSEMTIINWSSEDKVVQVRVQYDDEVVEESKYDVEARDTAIIDCSWPTTPGRFQIYTRENGEQEWTEEDFADFDSDCAYILIDYGRRESDPSFNVSDNCPESICE